MKKQIITIISVALVTALLFVAYGLFFKDDGIEDVGDPFYTLRDDVKGALAEVDSDIVLDLVGYNSLDKNWEMVYLFASEIVKTNNNFSLITSEYEGTLMGIAVRGEEKTESITLDSLFKKLYDGTSYAFDGESLITNAILAIEGKEKMEIGLRALSGYDTDGDVVTSSGAPFIFPSIERSKISFLTIKNSYGEYSIYQDEGKFYFGSSRAISYNDEMFSLLTTNCRHAVCYGKMDKPAERSWADYGLDGEKPATATYTLMTTEDANGAYFLHTVHIGSKSSSGDYYFARYVGAQFVSSKSDDVSDVLAHNLTKDKIYLIPVSAVDSCITLPQTDIMSNKIVNAISNTESLSKIGDIRIELIDEGVSALAQNISEFMGADNLASVDIASLKKVLANKVSANSDYVLAYPDGWKNHTDIFTPFTSTDGKNTAIIATLAKKAVSGEYKVVFGLLRDEANGAYLPTKLTIQKSYDGINWHSIENGEILTNQSDKTVKNYELTFSDSSVVKYIRIGFDVPQKAKTYVVMDEIRIYADGIDAQPLAVISGNWKLVAPTDYLPEGYNYALVDMNNFNNFVESIAILEGDRVVDCGFSDNGDASPSLLKKDILAKYGLDNPKMHYSFVYDGVVTDLYVSPAEEEGKFYAYTTFSGELNGKNVVATTDVIVELSSETTSWLAWDFVEYIDHSLINIKLVDVSCIEVSVDGTDYKFDIKTNENRSDLTSVTYNGKSYDIKSFKYLYQYMLSVNMQGEYVAQEGDSTTPYLKIKIHSETNSPELVFYRDNSSRCHFTIDGESSYYALVEDVNAVRQNILAFVAGETVTK